MKAIICTLLLALTFSISACVDTDMNNTDKSLTLEERVNSMSAKIYDEQPNGCSFITAPMGRFLQTQMDCGQKVIELVWQCAAVGDSLQCSRSCDTDSCQVRLTFPMPKAEYANLDLVTADGNVVENRRRLFNLKIQE